MSEQIPVREGLFVEAADGVKLIGNKCTSCGQVFFPRTKTICLNCLSDKLEDIQLDGKGKLYSYAESFVPSLHFRPPYTAGHILLSENIRVFSQLEPVEGKPFKIEMEMEMFIDKLWEEDGKDVIGYKFRPI